MSTYGDKTFRSIINLIEQLQDAVIIGYTQEFLKNILAQAASTIEIYLKRDAFPLKSNRDNFVSFIDELNNHVNNKNLIDNFHNIRLQYNLVKHDPNTSLKISAVINDISQLIPTISEINNKAIGQVNVPIRNNTTRIFWLCAWDHYIHGETEVTIFLPTKYTGFTGVPSIDLVHIKALDWDTFKSELPLFGNILPYDQWIPSEQSEFWFSQGDCLTPIVFEGEYGALLACLAKYESQETGRLPGLNRTDTSLHLYQSCLLATIDHISVSGVNINIENIINIVNAQYAVNPTENERARYFILKIHNLISKTPEKIRTSLVGPFWVTADELNNKDNYCHDSDIHTAIDRENRILLGIR